MRSTSFVAVAAALLGSTASMQAQGTLATRVARAPTGVVRVQFDGRPGVCGNGRDVVGFRNALFARNFQSIGKWNDARCIPGPLRVSLSVSNGHVTQMQTHGESSRARAVRGRRAPPES